MNKTLAAVIVIALLIVVGGGAFFAGTAYGQAQAQNTRAEFFRERSGTSDSQGNAAQQGQRSQLGTPVAFGTVKSVQGNTVQISTADSVVTVTLDAQTTIQKTVAGTTADIQPGDRITVFGEQSGNSVTARAIQLRPSGP